ncbi:Rib/alpha-like domain-containing protein [Trueperella pecoris]|uniref:Long Rib domain-containing protein n=1 Tax=Trueperella pecoris TaxID=2733571 RepID=A0A7M1QVB4_9ACTO|nr:Rib/alpha-like domain-containing protein [Trueperella pecoris]QOR45949.1 hypothetical protein INS88_01605 [Trueperella pecoris]
MAHGDKEKNKPEVKQNRELYEVAYTHANVPVGGAVDIPAPTDNRKHLGEGSNPFPQGTKFEVAPASFSNGLEFSSTGAIGGNIDPSYSAGKKPLNVKVTFPDGSQQIVDASYELMVPVTVTLDVRGYPDAKSRGEFRVHQPLVSAVVGGKAKDTLMVEGPASVWSAKIVKLGTEDKLRFLFIKDNTRIYNRGPSTQLLALL